MNKIDFLLDSLSKTKFRGSFHLNNNMKKYVLDKGFDKIKEDAFHILILNQIMLHQQIMK